MALLSENNINLVKDALLEGLDFRSLRSTILQGINFRFLGIIPHGGSDLAQLSNDLRTMNDAERLSSGEIPLVIYLNNALPFLFAKPRQEKIIRELLDELAHQTSGAPRIDPAEISETQERIIHSDDMVSHAYMKIGLATGDSVMRLRVKSHLNGQARKQSNGTDMYFSGTGWLIGHELMITNHHVINAREEGQPESNEADLKLQASHTQLIYGDNSEEIEPEETVMATSLLAYDKELDYAILRIPKTARSPLKIATQHFDPKGAAVPLNIIQHPRGKIKKYAIRNNLFSGSTPRDLRYFTDTDGGTSGSPVFDDSWQVVALHKSSLHISSVKFQGKDTAYINAGTRISLVIEDLQKRYPEIAAEAGYPQADVPAKAANEQSKNNP